MEKGMGSSRTSRLLNGTCVACDRRTGRRDAYCPYCGERVRRSLWWQAARWSALFLPPVLLICMVALAGRGWIGMAVRRVAGQPVNAFLLAAGVALLLLPVEDGDLVVSSAGELRRRQFLALLGGWAMGSYALAGAAICAASPAHVPLIILAGGLALSAAAMPFFLRIGWHCWAASALLAAAMLLS